MAIAKLNCPRCGANHTSFTLVWESSTPAGRLDRFATMICGACGDPSLVRFRYQRHVGPTTLTPPLNSFSLSIDTSLYETVEIDPKPPKTDAPDHAPAHVARAYVEAKRSLQIANWTAAGVMFRKSLDIATRALLEDEAEKKKPLIARIDALARLGRITADLKEWAHAIRVDGNDAAHEDEPLDRNEATRLWQFTELFLIYVYTLPGQLAARRAEIGETAMP